ncbi:unnamed protein product [Nezara viridula]|uniref:Uncharacterized protein n=1 Tax=Nezara viridula TaxID=85310 RepID=A0A9P0H260_NEZVI|nr:unnamed protein product [Nezara viridula]
MRESSNRRIHSITNTNTFFNSTMSEELKFMIISFIDYYIRYYLMAILAVILMYITRFFGFVDTYNFETLIGERRLRSRGVSTNDLFTPMPSRCNKGVNTINIRTMLRHKQTSTSSLIEYEINNTKSIRPSSNNSNESNGISLRTTSMTAWSENEIK